VNCEHCAAEIPAARRAALPGVRSCVSCEALLDTAAPGRSAYNRRGNKDSQLR
jgi:RNA polymerase-binding transcription factor DksA